MNRAGVCLKVCSAIVENFWEFSAAPYLIQEILVITSTWIQSFRRQVWRICCNFGVS